MKHIFSYAIKTYFTDKHIIKTRFHLLIKAKNKSKKRALMKKKNKILKKYCIFVFKELFIKHNELSNNSIIVVFKFQKHNL